MPPRRIRGAAHTPHRMHTFLIWQRCLLVVSGGLHTHLIACTPVLYGNDASSSYQGGLHTHLIACTPVLYGDAASPSYQARSGGLLSWQQMAQQRCMAVTPLSPPPPSLPLIAPPHRPPLHGDDASHDAHRTTIAPPLILYRMHTFLIW